jgi:hypothetical protein
MSSCSYCGQGNIDSDRFCHGCGKDLRPPPHAARTFASTQRFRRSVRAALIVSVVLYPVAALVDYLRIRAYYQTDHPLQSIGPDMGFGSKFAWMEAAGQSVLAFALIFISGLLFRKRGA